MFEQWYGFELLDRKRVVRPREILEWTRRLVHECGVFAGISSGAALAGAAKVAGEIDEGAIVFIVCDGGWKYLVDRRLHRRPRRGREAGRADHLLLGPQTSREWSADPRFFKVGQCSSSRVKVLALIALSTLSVVVEPGFAMPVAITDAAALPAGALPIRRSPPCASRIPAPTTERSVSREISDRVVRVQVAGKGGVPSNAVAAVLNVTGVNTTAPGFITVYPAGATLPTASNVNIDNPGRVMANMVTVKLGEGGAVDVFMMTRMDVVVDVSGAYVPTSVAVTSGRLVTRSDGAFRVLDTRQRGVPVGAGQTEGVDISKAGVPADAARWSSTSRPPRPASDSGRPFPSTSHARTPAISTSTPRPNARWAGNRAAVAGFTFVQRVQHGGWPSDRRRGRLVHRQDRGGIDRRAVRADQPDPAARLAQLVRCRPGVAPRSKWASAALVLRRPPLPSTSPAPNRCSPASSLRSLRVSLGRRLPT